MTRGFTEKQVKDYLASNELSEVATGDMADMESLRIKMLPQEEGIKFCSRCHGGLPASLGF